MQPDILLCRCERPLPEDSKKKISLFCNVDNNSVIPAVNVSNIYEVPRNLHKHGLDKEVCNFFNLKTKKPDLKKWELIEKRISNPPFLQECLSLWRFTVTQTHQLKNLLRKWLLLQPEKDVIDVLLPDCKDSRNVIQIMQLHLKNTPVRMDHD